MEVNILIVVDVANYLTNKDPKYIHMYDNVKESWGEGGNELTTAVIEGDSVRWTIVPASPSDQIRITGFFPYRHNESNYAFGRSGIANQPTQVDVPGVREYWQTAISSRENQVGHNYQYGISFIANSQPCSWDPHFHVESVHEAVMS